MRLLVAVLILTAPAWADGAQVPRSQRVRSGLLAPDRAARESAARLAKQWARTDPAGVDALYPDLDLRGRVALVRALAGAGTSHGATLALIDAGGEIHYQHYRIGPGALDSVFAGARDQAAATHGNDDEIDR